MLDLACTSMYLPESELLAAAETAVLQNPLNAPAMSTPAMAAMSMIDSDPLLPLRIAAATTKYWGTQGVKLTVGFMEPVSDVLADRIIAHMNAWGEYGNVSFVRSKDGPQVRITREGGGYWSYLGTDILHIGDGKPTMSLQGFSTTTPEAEFRRVVRHETGHTLGFVHEHMRSAIISRIDPDKAIEYFRRNQGWTRQMVIDNVLRPLEEKSLYKATNPDETSIMAYNLPAAITKDGRPIRGGNDIAAQDGAYVATIYPKAVAPQPPVQPPVEPTGKYSAEIAIAADQKVIYVRADAGWSVKKMASQSGVPTVPEEITNPLPLIHESQAITLADEGDTLLVYSDAPEGTAAAPGFLGVIGAGRKLVDAIRSRDLDVIRKAFLEFINLLLGDSEGLNFQQRQAALGGRINWAKVMEWLLKVAPLVLS